MIGSSDVVLIAGVAAGVLVFVLIIIAVVIVVCCMRKVRKPAVNAYVFTLHCPV